MRKSGRPGRVYRRCGCRDATRRQLGAGCPRLAEAGHGTWTFAVDMPSLSGRRRTVRRGGFEDEWHAETALRRFLEGRRLRFDADPHETVAAYLTNWLTSMEFLLKPTEPRPYWPQRKAATSAVPSARPNAVRLGFARLVAELEGKGYLVEHFGEECVDVVEQLPDPAEVLELRLGIGHLWPSSPWSGTTRPPEQSDQLKIFLKPLDAI
ncbi:hypothetical protein ACFWJ4_37610 [Kitasatospora sp. NPDC127067]|uniref:hypothetical protein n=1 Tax=Kitasatospora sp. NPDC127067 TaxID=3347126 RepID=UPI003649FC4A